MLSESARSPQRLSPKASRMKDRSSRGGTRSRKSRSPTAAHQHMTGRSLMLEQETACVGMSPSTAECLRAVFAANLWHQGLVHDAMACASFLKFHPNLPKQVDSITLRGDPRNRKTREEKARQRHSVGIFSTHMLTDPFASPLPVALEESWNAERAESTANQPLQPPDITENKVTSSLTPTLSLLVELWEKMSERCVELIQSEPVASSSALSVPLSQSESMIKSKGTAKTENRDVRDKERKRKSRRESIRPESNCELCGGLFAVPVTAHMRQAHPGCQKPALGLGYNPDGQYCGGWVGNCGEGGIQVRHFHLNFCFYAIINFCFKLIL